MYMLFFKLVEGELQSITSCTTPCLGAEARYSFVPPVLRFSHASFIQSGFIKPVYCSKRSG